MFRELHLLKNLFVPPERFWKKIYLAGTCELTNDEKELLRIALLGISSALDAFPPSKSDLKLNIFVIDTDKLTLHFNDPHSLGYHVSFIILPVRRWREAKYSSGSILIAMLEELCHDIWGIIDENIVKLRVEAVLKYIFPTLSARALYAQIVVENQEYCLNLASQDVSQHQREIHEQSDNQKTSAPE